MINRFFIACFMFIGMCVSSYAQKTVFVSDFGAIPNDNKDDAVALRKAAEYVRNNEGTVLVFSPGTYILHDDKAVELENTVMSGAYGQNPERKMFIPYHDYVRGLDFTGAKNATIMANGATLLLDGWMEGVSLEKTNNFKIKGLCIDFLRKPMSEGIITDIQNDNYTVYFDKPAREITMGTPFPRVNIWDNKIDGHYRDTHGMNREAVVAPNTVRFKGQLPKYLVGATVGAPHTFHYRPAIFIHESVNTTLDNVTINGNCGMGIVGFHTNTVTMNHLNVVPARGFKFSTNTDATHFAACEGKITFDHCTFYGEGDDATNVHGYYHDITAVEGNMVTLELKAPTFTHAQMSDLPRVGDVMTLVRIADLVPVGNFKVRSVEHKEKEVSFSIEVDGKLPANFKDYYFINSTLMPHVVFQNCVDWGHMARGILLKTTGGALIQNNVFRGLTHSAIALSSEANWKEGWHSKNVVIRNNKIMNCAVNGDYYGAGIALNIIADDVKNAKLHENIVIEGNEITSCTESECGILVSNARKVKVRNNIIKGCKKELFIENAEVTK